MKLIKLIEQLKNLQIQHGDKEVVVSVDYQNTQHADIEFIHYSNIVDKDLVIIELVD